MKICAQGVLTPVVAPLVNTRVAGADTCTCCRRRPTLVELQGVFTEVRPPLVKRLRMPGIC